MGTECRVSPASTDGKRQCQSRHGEHEHTCIQKGVIARVGCSTEPGLWCAGRYSTDGPDEAG